MNLIGSRNPEELLPSLVPGTYPKIDWHFSQSMNVRLAYCHLSGDFVVVWGS
jgi:hypothetical protein